ncbi:MAG: hypothetical protein CUN55_19080 [Phototrophicales bacterium]|nr:MAG: hypothetical protein CUN55_19080 [Phototrophicales bacterium]
MASKNVQPFISSKHRCEMVKLAIEDSDWIDCSQWEARYPRFVDFPAGFSSSHSFRIA